MNKKEMLDRILEMENEIKNLKEELNKQEEPKKRRWKPELGERYHYINSGGLIIICAWANDNDDNRRYAIGNIYRTEEEARFAVEQLKVLTELKEYADDNKEWNGDDGHWFIEYNANEKCIRADYFLTTKNIPFNIYFSSEEQAEKAINAIGKERLKKYYFCVEE